MSRYIDADAFDDTVQKLNEQGWYITNIDYKRMDNVLFEMPTADVVEVVRCKDYKYMCHYTDGHLECRLLSDLKPIPTTYCTMNADDFCSYGERRTE